MTVATEYARGALLKDAQGVTAALSRSIGGQAAAHLVHTAAVVGHAAAEGLIAPTGHLSADVEQVAGLHPRLAGFADPAVNRSYGVVVDVAPVVDLWEKHGESLREGPEYLAGFLLGDLYQQLSDEARKGRALCQTPQFITNLLLDISYDHAYEAWGPRIKMIDPACGTGHILITTWFRTYNTQADGMCRSSRDNSPRLRLFTPVEDRVREALNAVHGVDLDPYAVAVAAYRLLAAAAMKLRIDRREDDPAPVDLATLPVHVAAADTLLCDDEPLLQPGRYDVVVMNPPYITCKEQAAADAIRSRYRQVCNGRYSLALPFHARALQLLRPGGWCAQLTANSFTKREFGKRYVEQFLRGLDLQWVIDTSGAYIPGHGTPTLILANRNRLPVSDTLHTVGGVRGEPCVPEDPARGRVWRAIAEGVNEVLAYDRFAAAIDRERAAHEPAPAVALPTTFTQPTLFDLIPPMEKAS